jgi:hypothetical protein
VFKRHDLEPNQSCDTYHARCGLAEPLVGSSLCYYLTFVFSSSNFFFESAFDSSNKSTQEANIDNYKQYTKVEEVVKPLSRSLGMPDVA